MSKKESDVIVSTVKREYALAIIEIMERFTPRKSPHYTKAFILHTEENPYDNTAVRIVANEVTKDQKEMLTAIAYAYSMGRMQEADSSL
jgi:hypothetical protein